MIRLALAVLAAFVAGVAAMAWWLPRWRATITEFAARWHGPDAPYPRGPRPPFDREVSSDEPGGGWER